MATIDVDGFSMYYETEGSGEPVVFAHGVGGNHASWYNQVPAFAGRYQTIVFDHRGFGNDTSWSIDRICCWKRVALRPMWLTMWASLPPIPW